MTKFLFAVAIGVVGGLPAYAAPFRPPVDEAVPIIAVANGCGPGFFRTVAGNCVPNRRVLVAPGQAIILPPPCPRGFRRDPNPSRPICYPIY